MNAYTTIEESKQLIEAGLDVNTADMYYEEVYLNKNDEPCYITLPKIGKSKFIAPRQNLPCWSLTALLNVIDSNGLIYDISNDKNREFEILVYEANYISQEVKFHHTEHSIVDMIIWLLENNYIKI